MCTSSLPRCSYPRSSHSWNIVHKSYSHVAISPLVWCGILVVVAGWSGLDIARARFFGNMATLHPVPPGPKPIPHKDVNPSPTSPHALIPDPWLPIIQSTLTHPDDHIVKLHRSWAEYSSHFGLTTARYLSGAELKEAELIDCTLFVRVAGLGKENLLYKVIGI